MKKLYFLLTAIIFSLHCFAQREAIIKGSRRKVLLNADGTWAIPARYRTKNNTVRLEVSAIQANEYIIHHTALKTFVWLIIRSEARLNNLEMTEIVKVYP